MCLNKKGLETFDQARVYKKPRFGYKVVKKAATGWCTSEFLFPLKLGTWVNDPKCGTIYVLNSADLTYKKGFHIFLELEDAKVWCDPQEMVARVEYNCVVAKGFQNYHSPVIVARKIRLVEILQHE